MKKYCQGKYTPSNPHKYVGDITKIVFRSSWERRLIEFLDKQPAVLKWASEELVIPYFSPLDNKTHRYFVDFVAQIRTRSGEIKNLALEVKPKCQTAPPKQSKNKNYYIREVSTYIINTAKWKAATEWCLKNGMEFTLLTEDDLGIK